MKQIKGRMIVIHGPPKVGKTQLAASFPKNVLFLANERGHAFVPAGCKVMNFRPDASGWLKLKELIDSKKIEKSKFKAVTVDVATTLYYMCLEYVCQRDGVSHPSDGAHGKTWNAVRMEFAAGIAQLADQVARIDAYFIVIDHSKLETVETATGNYTKITCSMPGQARSVLLPVPDYIWYLGFDSPGNDELVMDPLNDFSGGRCLYIDGNHMIEAGTRDPSINVKVIRNLPKTNQYEHIIKHLTKETK